MDHVEFEAKEASMGPVITKKAIIIDLLAGTVAGITSTWAGYPLDLIKFRMQVAPELNFRHAIR